MFALCSRPNPRAAPMAGSGGGRGGGGGGGGDAEVDRARVWAGADGVGPSAASVGPARYGSESGNGNGVAAGSNEGSGVGPRLGQAPSPPKMLSAKGMLETQTAAADRHAGHGARCSGLEWKKIYRKRCDLIRAAEPHRTRQRSWAAAWDARAPFGCTNASHRRHSIRPHAVQPSVRSWAHPRHASIHAEALRPSARLRPGAGALRPAYHCWASGVGGRGCVGSTALGLAGTQQAAGGRGWSAGVGSSGLRIASMRQLHWGGRLDAQGARLGGRALARLLPMLRNTARAVC